MSLEPCNVCGTINAAETEICLSCGYPTRGNKRPAIFRWVAIALAACFTLPFLAGLINWILLQVNPKLPDQNPQKVSLYMSKDINSKK